MTKKIYIILFLIVLFFILLGLLLKKDPFDNADDIVVNLILFHSEGPPYDNASNFTQTTNEIIEFAKPHVDNIFVYTPRILKNLGYGKYVKDYDDLGEAYLNPGIQHIGFLGFRPLIFLLELEKMKDGEILVHRDTNYKKYPSLQDYSNFKSHVLKYLKECNFDVFIARENENLQLINHCKTNVINELGENDEFVKNFPLLICNFIIMRKSKVTMELIKEWLFACEHEEWINGKRYGEMDPRYRWSTSEQCILGIIIAKWVKNRKHNIPINYPDVITNRTITDLIKPTNYDYLKYIN